MTPDQHELHMTLSLIKMLGVVLGALQILMFPLLGVIWKMISKKLDQSVSAEMCTLRHDALESMLSQQFGPIRERLDTLCAANGRVPHLEDSMTALRERVVRLETTMDRFLIRLDKVERALENDAK